MITYKIFINLDKQLHDETRGHESATMHTIVIEKEKNMDMNELAKIIREAVTRAVIREEV